MSRPEEVEAVVRCPRRRPVLSRNLGLTEPELESPLQKFFWGSSRGWRLGLASRYGDGGSRSPSGLAPFFHLSPAPEFVRSVGPLPLPGQRHGGAQSK